MSSSEEMNEQEELELHQNLIALGVPPLTTATPISVIYRDNPEDDTTKEPIQIPSDPEEGNVRQIVPTGDTSTQANLEQTTLADSTLEAPLKAKDPSSAMIIYSEEVTSKDHLLIYFVSSITNS